MAGFGFFYGHLADPEPGPAGLSALLLRRQHLGYACQYGGGVVEEVLDPRAEVVQAKLAIRGPDQTILGAFAPAERQVGALAAIFGQAVPLGHAKGLLAGGEGHVAQGALFDIPQPVLRIDEVMASALPQNSAVTQSWEGYPMVWATAVSNRLTSTRPRSLLTHSSNTAVRKVPQSSGSTDQSVTIDIG